MSVHLTIVPAPPGLLERSGLLVPRDIELQKNGFRAPNRSLRLFVAAFMLGTDRSEANALSAAQWLYDSNGVDLDKPGDLTQASIELEVFRMVDNHNLAVDKH